MVAWATASHSVCNQNTREQFQNGASYHLNVNQLCIPRKNICRVVQVDYNCLLSPSQEGFLCCHHQTIDLSCCCSRNSFTIPRQDLTWTWQGEQIDLIQAKAIRGRDPSPAGTLGPDDYTNMHRDTYRASVKAKQISFPFCRAHLEFCTSAHAVHCTDITDITVYFQGDISRIFQGTEVCQSDNH